MIVADVLQNVKTDDGVYTVLAEVNGGIVEDVHVPRGQVWRSAEVALKLGDALGVHVDTDYALSVQQVSGEVTQATADLHHALAQLGARQPGLPFEVVGRALHALLVANLVVGFGGDPAAQLHSAAIPDTLSCSITKLPLQNRRDRLSVSKSVSGKQ